MEKHPCFIHLPGGGKSLDTAHHTLSYFETKNGVSRPSAAQPSLSRSRGSGHHCRPLLLRLSLPMQNLFEPPAVCDARYLSASANCWAVTPSTSTVLRRLVRPAVMRTRDLAMP